MPLRIDKFFTPDTMDSQSPSPFETSAAPSLIIKTNLFPQYLRTSHLRLLARAAAICFGLSGVFPAIAAIKAPDTVVDQFRAFYVGGSLDGVLFDGTYIWVADGSNDTISKLQPDDGTVIEAFPAMGSYPQHLAYDGENIWVTTGYLSYYNVNKLRASDGTFLGSFYAGDRQPAGIVYAGGKIWVSGYDGGYILRPSDGKTVGYISGGSVGLTSDGKNVWIANSASNTVQEYSARDGTFLDQFAVGAEPWGVAFSRGNIWVANYLDDTVSKLRARDGTLLQTFKSGGKSPNLLAVDGAENVWIAHLGFGVSELRGSDGLVERKYPFYYPSDITSDGVNVWVPVGPSVARFNPLAKPSYSRKAIPVEEPSALTFDGTNIWVTQSGPSSVTELRASDGAVVGVYSAGGNFSGGATFDGTYIWIANGDHDTVVRLLQSDGSMQGSFPVGEFPDNVLFDGTNIWVTNLESNNVTKLRASDGTLLGTFRVGASPRGIAYDGKNIWVTNSGSNTVTRLRGSDGAPLGTFTVGNGPLGIVFDGTYIWVSNAQDATVTKLQTSGTVLETTGVGAGPGSLAVDGTNLLLSCEGASTVEQRGLDSADYQHNYGYLRDPGAVLFDGTSIWVTDWNGVTKFTPNPPQK
ncbi:MAG TPA: hypothetical protein VGG02_00840 [Chthoniobacterales bacterium]|jgi:outer membrane protein assembly factor BamB